MDTIKNFKQCMVNRDIPAMIEQIPYAGLIGIELDSEKADGTPVFRLNNQSENIGNPILPAIHGGVIGVFMELSAAFHLLATMNELAIPKIIDFSLDYLRAGRC